MNEQQRFVLSRRQQEIKKKPTNEIIKLLAKQNLAMREHDESETYLINLGDFLELVYHQAQYDLLLHEHLKAARGTYLSQDIQNELIMCLADKMVMIC